MNLEVSEEKGNMRTLEQKVDILMRYCVAESEQARQYYHADLQSMLTAAPCMDVRRSVDRALSDLGIPAHLLGYAYLQSAIAMVIEQPDSAYAVTGIVYPGVALRYSTTAQLVERAIRHAVERGWSRCDSSMREKYFGGKIRPGRQKPTNAEFIARIANLVRS
jgi:two-component system response regulator (stage 0 sporulation protein A)